jgi:gas vesicle protein
MSYAGPASRTKRGSDPSPATAEGSRGEVPKARSTNWPQPSASDERNSATVFAAGIVVGIAVGAGVALLFAPDSGIETRRSIVRRSRRVGRRSRDAWDDLRDELRNAVRNRRRAWRLKRQRARDAAENGA